MTDPQPSEYSGAIGERRAAIAPYLLLIGAGKAQAQAQEQQSATRIAIEDRVIELDSWEWSTLAKGLAPPNPVESDAGRIAAWPQRLAEGVAFQARYLTHISRLQDGPAPAPSELDGFRQELITDVAVGLALQEEIQQDINNLVAVGALDDAKRLTGFRHKIGQGIGRLKEVLGEAGFERAEAKAVAMACTVPRQSRTHRPFEEYDERPAPARFERYHGSVQQLRLTSTGRVKPLLIVLVLSAIACGAVQLATRHRAGPPPLPAETFGQIAGIRQVDVRPPSLFVTVEAQLWGEWSEPERLALVDRVAEIAAQNGYHGAHFRTTAGVAVAQWLERSGPRLLEPKTAANSPT